MSDVPINVPEWLELITAHLTPTHLLPSPLFLQAFVTIPPPPSHPELICAPHSHSILNMANSIQAVEGERPWSGNGEVGKSWVRAEQLQCYSKMTSTPACFCSWEPGTPQGNQESLRASVLYRRVTYCSQNPLGRCYLNQWIHWKLHLFDPSKGFQGLDKTSLISGGSCYRHCHLLAARSWRRRTGTPKNIQEHAFSLMY